MKTKIPIRGSKFRYRREWGPPVWSTWSTVPWSASLTSTESSSCRAPCSPPGPGSTTPRTGRWGWPRPSGVPCRPTSTLTTPTSSTASGQNTNISARPQLTFVYFNTKTPVSFNCSFDLSFHSKHISTPRPINCWRYEEYCHNGLVSTVTSFIESRLFQREARGESDQHPARHPGVPHRVGAELWWHHCQKQFCGDQREEKLWFEVKNHIYTRRFTTFWFE